MVAFHLIKKVVTFIIIKVTKPEIIHKIWLSL